MRLEGSACDFALVSCHAALSLSSVAFRLPAAAARAYADDLPRVPRAQHHLRCPLGRVLHARDVRRRRAAVCVAAMLAADAASARLADKTTMRSMPFPSELTAGGSAGPVTIYHSLSQAHATALMLLGADTALLAIQLAAFLMTLVRKGLIFHEDVASHVHCVPRGRHVRGGRARLCVDGRRQCVLPARADVARCPEVPLVGPALRDAARPMARVRRPFRLWRRGTTAMRSSFVSGISSASRSSCSTVFFPRKKKWPR
jgi:hypothetical protein